MTDGTKKAMYWGLGILGGIGLIWGAVAMLKKPATTAPPTDGRNTPAPKNRMLSHGSPVYSEIPVQAYINTSVGYKPYGQAHPAGELIGYYDTYETKRSLASPMYLQTRREMDMSGDLIWIKTDSSKLYTK